MPIQCARVQTIPFGRDHGISPHPLDRIAEDCGVIAFVCQYGFARETVNQGCWLARIRKLAQVLTADAAGYPGIYSRVSLGAQAASGLTHGLGGRDCFFAASC